MEPAWGRWGGNKAVCRTRAAIGRVERASLIEPCGLRPDTGAMRIPRIGRSARAACIGIAILSTVVSPVHGQAGARGDSARVRAVQPDLHGWREIGLSVLGGSFLLSAHLAPVQFRAVPTDGFDLREIGFSLDRSAVGEASTGASAFSNWTRNAAMVFPFAVNLATGTRGARASGFARTAVVYAETMLMSQGLTFLGKKLLGRPRPYAYLPAAARPRDSSYDVTRDRTFVSMPSGHSSSAWTGAAMGLTEYLLNRPVAPWWERVGIGFIGGALAGATSALRVEAGQHFPSDVIAGAGIGMAVGVTIPLLHRGSRDLPSRKAWLQTAGGVLLGSLLGAAASDGS